MPARAAGTRMMTLWLGQDGFDYPFQADYATLLNDEITGIREVALHDPDCLISIEYKPNEPRSFSLMPDCASTLLMLKEIGLPNLGVTLDFAHMLYADEQPAFAAALVARHSRVLGLHLNDGYAKRDDGLMVGAVHPQQTIELLRQVRRDGYAGPIYFDTFPDLTGLDPVQECETNIATVKQMMSVVDRLDRDNRSGRCDGPAGGARPVRRSSTRSCSAPSRTADLERAEPPKSETTREEDDDERPLMAGVAAASLFAAHDGTSAGYGAPELRHARRTGWTGRSSRPSSGPCRSQRPACASAASRRR